MNDLQKMKELIQKINAADEAYFKNDSPIMTDREYDALVLELKMLERITGIHFSNSPIGKVPGDEKAELKTVRHSRPMLSCNKTKNASGDKSLISSKGSSKTKSTPPLLKISSRSRKVNILLSPLPPTIVMIPTGKPLFFACDKSKRCPTCKPSKPPKSIAHPLQRS